MLSSAPGELGGQEEGLAMTKYHVARLEGGNDAAQVTLLDGSIIIISARGSVIVHDKNGVVLSNGSAYVHVAPMFTTSELALLLDAVMVFYQRVERVIENDDSNLPVIEALQRKIEAIIQPLSLQAGTARGIVNLKERAGRKQENVGSQYDHRGNDARSPAACG
jgi:hypothetical protein